MRFGVFMFSTDESIAPDEMAREAEAHGFDSLFLPEHTHIPASRKSPYPSGGSLPREYTRTYDPFVALATAASVTDHLLLGFGICLVVERDPIVTAKAVASLDHLSGGRVLLGVGAGWNREEMRNHATDPASRFDVLTERVMAMRRLWQDDEATFHGEYVSFEEIWSWPKPLQVGGPPVLVGGSGPRVYDRVLEIGDAWMPVGWRDVDGLPDRIKQLAHRAERKGRPRPSVTIYGALPRPDLLETYQELGVERCVFALPSGGRDEVLPALAEHAALATGFSSRRDGG